MLEGNCKSAKALSVVSVETNSRLVEGVTLPAFARFESFHAVLCENLNHRKNAFVQPL